MATLDNDLRAIPKEFVNEGSTRLYALDANYPTTSIRLYSNDFQLAKTIQFLEPEKTFDWITYMDYDLNGYAEANCDITQTLFNSDEKYEFIVGIGDKMGYNIEYTGFKVISDDGTLVNQVTFPDVYTFSKECCQVIKFNNKYYLEFNASDASLIYEIKGGTDGIQLQSIIPMEVSPTVVKKGSPIKVTLGESDGDKTITITDISGKTIQQMTMPESLTEVSVNTANFSAGMNLITISKNGTVLNTVKVIVE